MSTEKRTEAVYIRLRPSLRDAIVSDAADRGQTISIWAERAFLAALAQPDLPLEDRGGG